MRVVTKRGCGGAAGDGYDDAYAVEGGDVVGGDEGDKVVLVVVVVVVVVVVAAAVVRATTVCTLWNCRIENLRPDQQIHAKMLTDREDPHCSHYATFLLGLNVANDKGAMMARIAIINIPQPSWTPLVWKHQSESF